MRPLLLALTLFACEADDRYDHEPRLSGENAGKGGNDEVIVRHRVSYGPVDRRQLRERSSRPGETEGLTDTGGPLVDATEDTGATWAADG